jgi:hypothetical protein
MNLLDEIINKLEQKSTYFVNLYRNDRAKAYKDLGFNSLRLFRVLSATCFQWVASWVA